ncbi:VWA domain-containing protein [Acinetobacter sp. R933-2]|nr:VWA domain-containing protein [Acinetobacter sp. R933-2]
MKMKYTILVASMMTVLLSGCSKKTEEAVSDMAATEVVAADAVVEAEAYGSEGSTENYQKNEQNTVKVVAKEPVSTFSADVDTGSYANVRRFLTQDKTLPPVDAVRVEEMINYFNYHYPQPTGQHPFSVNTETVDSPWQANAKVIRIGIQAKNIDQKQLPPANLVFLVDVSGSMDEEKKLPLVKKTLTILTEQLRPQDKVTLITYSGHEEVVLEPTSGNEKSKILNAINDLSASGSTSGESAIQMAYKEAQKSFIQNGINRILIATDGDFNVGITDFDTLKNMIAEKRKTGISFTTLGFGRGNYDEQLMEQLADAGDGNYSYIDNENEAKKVLKQQLSSTLATVAQDVKIQVEFNPATVKEYRLIGYENRMLKQEDFNNDQVDAGDIGAGHTVTALYEIIPTGQKGWLADSRYQNEAKAQGSKTEYAYLNLRYKLPNQTKSILLTQPISASSKPLTQASGDTRFALAVASYGQQLNSSKYMGSMGWNDILQLAQSAQQPDEFGLKDEFIGLLKKAKSLSSDKPTVQQVNRAS